MRPFHVFRLVVAALAALGCAVALALTGQSLHESLAAGVALVMAAANWWSAVGVLGRRGAAIGFSYTLYFTNLYGAAIGWFVVAMLFRSRDAQVGGYVSQLCLAVGALFLVPVMSRFGVDDPPAIKRGVIAGIAFTVAMTVSTLAIFVIGMA